MDKWQNKVAVVTGASSGIGACLIERLVEEGLQVVGLARRNEIVETISKKLLGKRGKLYAIKCDITKEEEVIKVFHWIKNHLGPVQLLVNNAVYFPSETITEGKTESWKAILDTCLFGLALCTREAVAQMREANIEGQIININSGSGHIVAPRPYPIYNLYPSVKHGMTAFNEVMTQEMNFYKANIRFTSLSPGLVHKTGLFTQTNIVGMNPDEVEKFPHMYPNDVVEAIIYIMSTPLHVQVYELMLKPFNVCSK